MMCNTVWVTQMCMSQLRATLACRSIRFASPTSVLAANGLTVLGSDDDGWIRMQVCWCLPNAICHSVESCYVTLEVANHKCQGVNAFSASDMI
jgi:hypothetical protein